MHLAEPLNEPQATRLLIGESEAKRTRKHFSRGHWQEPHCFSLLSEENSRFRALFILIDQSDSQLRNSEVIEKSDSISSLGCFPFKLLILFLCRAQ